MSRPNQRPLYKHGLWDMKHSNLAAAGALLIIQAASAPAWADAALDACADATKADAKIKACTVVIEADGVADLDMAEALAQRGFGHYTNNRYRYAFPDLDKAIELDPENHLAWWTRAMSKKFMGQHDKSIADFDEALRIKPDDAETYMHRGGAFYGGGLFERAIEDYDRAIAIDPEYAEAYFFRAVIFRDMKEHEKATTDLKRAHELVPDNPVYRQAMKDRGLLD